MMRKPWRESKGEARRLDKTTQFVRACYVLETTIRGIGRVLQGIVEIQNKSERRKVVNVKKNTIRLAYAVSSANSSTSCSCSGSSWAEGFSGGHKTKNRGSNLTGVGGAIGLTGCRCRHLCGSLWFRGGDRLYARELPGGDRRGFTA